MKKVSSYLVLIIILGALFVGYWAYRTYFVRREVSALSFTVSKGGLFQMVSARGEVIAQKKFDLRFPFSGIVKHIYVREGAKLKQGDKIISLDTTGLLSERDGLLAEKRQAEASLQKILNGANAQDIRVAEEKLTSAEIAFEDAQKNLKDKIKDAYSKTDDAIRTKTDSLFDNPQTGSPVFHYSLSDQQLKRDLESGRTNLERILDAWLPLVDIDVTEETLIKHFNTSMLNIDAASSLLNKMALAINSLAASQEISQTTLDGYKTSITSARASMSLISASLVSANEKLRAADADIKLRQKELDTLKAPARSEDVAVAEEKIKQIDSNIEQTNDKLSKATLTAPTDGEVTKIWVEAGEVSNLGENAVSFSATGLKIQSDISEINIRNISEKDGNIVNIVLDAFPEVTLKGRVLLIESEPVFKDEEVFYRVVIEIPTNELPLRIGMSADLEIMGLHKENVLKIPELAVIEHDGKKFVDTNEKDATIEREITTGISDGNEVEILSGLTFGEKIFVHSK